MQNTDSYKSVDFGTNGRISDGGVLQNTSFFEKLVNEDLHIPQIDDVTDNLKNDSYVFVADDAFPLRTDILKLFRQERGFLTIDYLEQGTLWKTFLGYLPHGLLFFTPQLITREC